MQPTLQPKPNHHFYFVTGKLAQVALREVVESLAVKFNFRYTIGVMPITVAALMNATWLKRHLDVPREATHVILPGYCDSDWQILDAELDLPVILGPKDCRDLAVLFGAQSAAPDLREHSIEIIAEINHATRRSVDEVIAEAVQLAQQGADVIDFGCDPSQPVTNVGDYVRALREANLRVSIDSFDIAEVNSAVQAGAELVLSVNASNREAAVDWGTEVVVIPDSTDQPESLDRTIESLLDQNVPIRIDPILEPIGTGFGASLLRYADIRRRYPDLPIMMGIGNLSELTDVDSAGINFLLLGICQEWNIQSVLTTQVINWARSSVRECDIARRLVHYSQRSGVPPKRLSDQLVMLRDVKLRPYSDAALRSLVESIRDKNYRLLAQDELLHLIAADIHITGKDPFSVFDELISCHDPSNIDSRHAFYLGFELAKASIALTLGKQYTQDQALDWGHLTVAEQIHRRSKR